jgi:hypothetical protein
MLYHLFQVGAVFIPLSSTKRREATAPSMIFSMNFRASSGGRWLNGSSYWRKRGRIFPGHMPMSSAAKSGSFESHSAIMNVECSTLFTETQL